MKQKEYEPVTWAEEEKVEYFDSVAIDLPPTPNIEVRWGDNLVFSFTAKKTLVNRFKFWLLCKLLPYKVTRWIE